MNHAKKSGSSSYVKPCPWDAPTYPAEKKAQPAGMNLYGNTAYRHQCPVSIILAGRVESPKGTAPSGSHRSVREPLDSYGSSCLSFSKTEIPVREQLRQAFSTSLEPRP